MPAPSSGYAATCTGEHSMTVRLPIWAGPDSGVYHGVMPSELRCCSDRSDRFRFNEMLACVCLLGPPRLCHVKKHDHSLYMGPLIICPSAHVGWTGPEQTLCACVANVVVYSCSHLVQVWQMSTRPSAHLGWTGLRWQQCPTMKTQTGAPPPLWWTRTMKTWSVSPTMKTQTSQ